MKTVVDLALKRAELLARENRLLRDQLDRALTLIIEQTAFMERILGGDSSGDSVESPAADDAGRGETDRDDGSEVRPN